jgi:phenylalanyl-tRNA synthetase alpha chain
VSRSKNDCFYVNRNYLLRAHTTCHDNELIRSGLNAFLTFGDVYRRDEIDAKHYPVFHQCDGVRLFNRHDLVQLTTKSATSAKNDTGMDIFERKESSSSSSSGRSAEKQAVYTMDASKLVEFDLKNCLTGLAEFVFGSCMQNYILD